MDFETFTDFTDEFERPNSLNFLIVEIHESEEQFNSVKTTDGFS